MHGGKVSKSINYLDSKLSISSHFVCVTVYLCLLWSTNMRALSNVIQPTTIDRCTNPLPPLLKLDPQNLCFGDTYLVCTNKEADFGKKENGRGNDGGGGIQVVSIFEQFSVTIVHTPYTLTHSCSVCKVCSEK